MPMNLMLRILAVLRGGKSQYLIIVKPIHQQKNKKSITSLTKIYISLTMQYKKLLQFAISCDSNLSTLLTTTKILGKSKLKIAESDSIRVVSSK